MTPLSREEGRAVLAIDLPWPSRDLHPNARVHWARKASAAAKARRDASVATRAAKVGRIEADALKVTAVFAPPNNRARDDDGLIASMKSALDGIADIIGVDDSKWRIFVEREPARKGGNVRVEIEVPS